jgi:endo-cleaving rubber dioxygenase
LNPAPSIYLRCDPNDDPISERAVPADDHEHRHRNRKVYNVYMYGQGNGGHEFSSVLTDQERAAIIEYLKTL